MNFCTEQVQHDLILVWRNPPQELQKEIRKKGLDNRIHFLSNITDTDLALLYNGATAMFFPSAYEGLTTYIRSNGMWYIGYYLPELFIGRSWR